MDVQSANIDFTALWTGVLLFCRFGAMLFALPGIGTRQIPETVHALLAVGLAAAYGLVCAPAPYPEDFAVGGLMIISELLLGYTLGAIPTYITSSLAVSGQITSASIGLGQANLIDPSLGESVSVLARLQLLFGTLLFLAIDGHHAIIRAASGLLTDLPVGIFRPNMAVADILLKNFSVAFELAITLTAPIIVTVLLTQFIFGLITKFVPQVNIFIVSLPLSIGLGLYIVQFTFPGVAANLLEHFKGMEETAAGIMIAGQQ